VVLAYEPVWAIGTGETASQNKHKCINSSGKQFGGIRKRYRISILYGGSVKPENAKEIFLNQM
jgi:triosephosphate isomerase